MKNDLAVGVPGTRPGSIRLAPGDSLTVLGTCQAGLLEPGKEGAVRFFYNDGVHLFSNVLTYHHIGYPLYQPG